MIVKTERIQLHNRYYLQELRAELTVLIDVMEHDNNIDPKFWQLLSVKEQLKNIDKQIQDPRAFH